METRIIYNWLIGGYWPGTITKRGLTIWMGYYFNHDTLRGRFSYWLLNLDCAMRRSPHDLKLWLADQLSRAAMRLRGEKVSVFGFYDYAKGNRAAQLCDAVDFDHCLNWSNDEADMIEENRARLQELASLAGATWRSNP